MPMPMPMSRRPLFLAPVSLALMLAACSHADSSAPAAGSAPVLVETALAASASVPEILEAVGNVEAVASVALKSRVDGQIADVPVRDGQDVKKGDVLFRLEPRPLEITVMQAEAALARDQALHEKAQAQQERYEKLLPQGYVSADDYAQVKANAAAAAATVKADEAALAEAKLQLSYTVITAPISGRAGKVLLQTGNLVKANADTPLLVLNQLEPVYVSFALPERYLPQLRAAMAARAPQVDISGQENVRGRVSFLDNAVDPGTGTVKLRASFDNADRSLWPGQFVNVALHLREQQDALTVPPSAVLNGPNGSYVFVVGQDKKAEQRAVQVERATTAVAVIAQGLSAGERVITDGQSRVLPGAPVAFKEASPAQSESAGAEQK